MVVDAGAVRMSVPMVPAQSIKQVTFLFSHLVFSLNLSSDRTDRKCSSLCICVPCRWRRSLWRRPGLSTPPRPNSASSCQRLPYPRSSPTSPTFLPLSWHQPTGAGTWATRSCQHNTSHRFEVFLLNSSLNPIHISTLPSHLPSITCNECVSLSIKPNGLQLPQPQFVTPATSSSFPATPAVQAQARLPLNG